MASRVVLECTRGRLAGKRFTFPDRATCVMGRSADCFPQIPDEGESQFISRYHCLLDINPPHIRVRDFGSLNGTFVNNVKIGQRTGGEISYPQLPGDSREHSLVHGDSLRIADCEFRVIVDPDSRCDSCGRDLAEGELAEVSGGSGRVLCSFCRKSEPEPPPGAAGGGLQCASCSRPVSSETTRTSHGDVLCDVCRGNPGDIAERWLEDMSRSESLTALQGYQIVRQIGQGGMGVVYLARHPESGRNVALKVLLPKVAVNPYAVKMFQREIAITRRMDHANVVRLVDSGFADGAFFLCLEYCAGGSASDYMKSRGGSLDVADAVAIIEQTLDALEYAHCLRAADSEFGGKAGEPAMVHRDVKPKNILLVEPGSVARVKLGDFGLSKAFDLTGLSGMTRSGETCGTPYFVCRQQVLNYKYSKPEVDLWATAASLYHLITGAYPREFSKGADMWQTILQTDPVPVRSRRADVPPRLAKFIDHALRDRPAIPYQDVGSFRAALRRALA